MNTPVVVQELRVRKTALFLAAFLWTLVVIGIFTIAYMVYRMFTGEETRPVGWQEIVIMVVLGFAIFAMCFATLYVVVTRRDARKRALKSEAVRIRDSRKNRLLKKQIRQLDEIARRNREDETSRSRVRNRNRALEIQNSRLEDDSEAQQFRNQELLRSKRDLKAKIKRMKEEREEENAQQREQEEQQMAMQQQQQGFDPAMNQQMQQQNQFQQQQY